MQQCALKVWSYYGICPGPKGESGLPGKTLFQFLDNENEDQAEPLLELINEVAKNMTTQFK